MSGSTNACFSRWSTAKPIPSALVLSKHTAPGFEKEKLTVRPLVPPPLALLGKERRRRVPSLSPLRALLLLDALLFLLGQVDVAGLERELIWAEARVGRRDRTRFERGGLVELGGKGREAVVLFGVWQIRKGGSRRAK